MSVLPGRRRGRRRIRRPPAEVRRSRPRRPVRRSPRPARRSRGCRRRGDRRRSASGGVGGPVVDPVDAEVALQAGQEGAASGACRRRPSGSGWSVGRASRARAARRWPPGQRRLGPGQADQRRGQPAVRLVRRGGACAALPGRVEDLPRPPDQSSPALTGDLRREAESGRRAEAPAGSGAPPARG